MDQLRRDLWHVVNLTALINPFHVTRGHLLGKHPGAGVGEGQSRLEEERGAGADPDPDHLEDQVGHRLVHVLVVHFDDPVLADQAMERDPDRAGFGAGPTQRASVGEFFKFLVAAQNWREDFTQRTGVDGAVALAPNVTINWAHVHADPTTDALQDRFKFGPQGVGTAVIQGNDPEVFGAIDFARHLLAGKGTVGG